MSTKLPSLQAVMDFQSYESETTSPSDSSPAHKKIKEDRNQFLGR
jgi:hypothetical protein